MTDKPKELDDRDLEQVAAGKDLLEEIGREWLDKFRPRVRGR